MRRFTDKSLRYRTDRNGIFHSFTLRTVASTVAKSLFSLSRPTWKRGPRSLIDVGVLPVLPPGATRAVNIRSATLRWVARVASHLSPTQSPERWRDPHRGYLGLVCFTLPPPGPIPRDPVPPATFRVRSTCALVRGNKHWFVARIQPVCTRLGRLVHASEKYPRISKLRSPIGIATPNARVAVRLFRGVFCN